MDLTVGRIVITDGYTYPGLVISRECGRIAAATQTLEGMYEMYRIGPNPSWDDKEWIQEKQRVQVRERLERALRQIGANGATQVVYETDYEYRLLARGMSVFFVDAQTGAPI